MRHSLLAALALSPLLPAQSPVDIAWMVRDPEAVAQAVEFRGLEVPGKKVRPAVTKVARQLHWHRTLKSAVREARAADKPILWVQALGNLTGYT